MHSVNRDGDVTNSTKLWPVPRFNSCDNWGAWNWESGRFMSHSQPAQLTHTSLLRRCVFPSVIAGSLGRSTDRGTKTRYFVQFPFKQYQRCFVSTICGCGVTQISGWGNIPRRRYAPRAGWDPFTRCSGCFQETQIQCWCPDTPEPPQGRATLAGLRGQRSMGQTATAVYPPKPRGR